MSNVQLKKNLSSQELLILQTELDKKKKKKGTALVLWWFTGVFGGHRFYLGDTGYALGMLFTLGGIGFWSLFDVFLISGRVEEKNNEIEREVILNLGIGQ